MMKKIVLMLFAMLFSFSSCSSDDDPALVGKGEIMEISAENATLDNSKGEATLYIDVPAAESTFSLKVTNYDDWWIHSFSVKELSSNSYVLVPKIDNKKVSYKDWFNAMVASNQLKCTISENISSVPRTIKMEMTVGDVFETIYIVQAAPSK